MELTTSQVNKAGKTLRRFLRGDASDMDKVLAARQVLIAFRAEHQYPMIAANMGLRSVTNTVRCDKPKVSQRLKRVPTILDKIEREPTLPLASMQDLGGCRAVLSNVGEVRRVQARLGQLGRVVRVDDYIDDPRQSGYRGVHLIVQYRGRRSGSALRNIEIQLRTWTMHQWAVFVESLTGAIDQDVKSGRGAPEVQDLMRVISQAMALEEADAVVDDALLNEMARLRVAAAPYMTGERR